MTKANDLPEALQGIISDSGLHEPEYKTSVESEEWKLYLKPSVWAGRSKKIDLSKLPSSLSLTFELGVRDARRDSRQNRNSITFMSLKPGCSFGLAVNESLDVHLEGFLGKLNARSLADDASLNFTECSGGEISLMEGEFEISLESGASTLISLEQGASLKTKSRLPEVKLLGDCSIYTRRKYERIDCLTLCCESATVEILEKTLYVDKVESVNTASPGTLIMRSPESSGVGGGVRRSDYGAEIRVKYLTDIILEAASGVALKATISRKAENVTFANPMDVEFTKSAEATRIRAVGQDEKRVCLKSQRSTLHYISGSWAISEVSESVLRGSEDEFEIFEIVPLKSNSVANEPRFHKEPFKGAVLIGFTLPITWKGRQVLSELKDAYHVDPSAGRMQGREKRFHCPRKLLLKKDPLLPEEITRSAEFIDELARRSKEKGAPGSTRTKIAWWGYRLRHLVSNNFWERLALLGYRALGYGERPIPAFATWGLLSLFMTVLFLSGRAFDPTVGGLALFLTELASYALGPLGALMSTGTAEASPWEYIARSIIAIPLVTGALALRNYVKQVR